MKRKNLYNNDGTPKRICCYWCKTGELANYIDPITVVFTYAHYMDEEHKHRAVYMGLSKCGGYYFGSAWQYEFMSRGSRVNFNELPEPCQEAVRDIYKKVWEENYFIMN